jgi:hypothetical protein
VALGRGGGLLHLRRDPHDGAIEALLVFVVFGLVCRAAVEALPSGDGLREYRQ